MNIVILDGLLANPGDLSWEPVSQFGPLVLHDYTPPEAIVERSRNAEVLITNKVKLGAEHFEQLPDLQLICLLATGFDNIDVVAAHQHGITVCNAVGYSSESVAQHVMALLLQITNDIGRHNQAIQDGEWSRRSWSFSLGQLKGLAGKKFGIVGYGKIGRTTARLAEAFGMEVCVYTRSNLFAERSNITPMTLEELFKESDILSLHVPLNAETSGMINKVSLSQMKKDAILINTARGGLINEVDLSNHLMSHSNFYAALDVLSNEPPATDHPLIGLPNCILTPHYAWANRDARMKLIDIVAQNIRSFQSGNPINVVKP